MDKLQRQIMELNYKVDRLYQILERMSQQTNSLNCEIQKDFHQNSSINLAHSSEEKMMSSFSKTLPNHSPNNGLDLMIGHKDIINDDDDNFYENYSYSHCQGEYEISSELQIQRLTAQLTAAYHRIAALEEQLLAKRI